eukprot:NODE_952_length_1298_cov_270.015286.p1 GENE.NODE_952_length_1298_cov_270.015286~~NODE_952_length_1298_cov_270.015286.p1  ORF type:complete len:190 (-),score=50.19 NODE_952_length_1298_cov_270.015286:711-1280(-)
MGTCLVASADKQSCAVGIMGAAAAVPSCSCLQEGSIVDDKGKHNTPGVRSRLFFFVQVKCEPDTEPPTSPRAPPLPANSLEAKCEPDTEPPTSQRTPPPQVNSLEAITRFDGDWFHERAPPIEVLKIADGIISWVAPNQKVCAMVHLTPEGMLETTLDGAVYTASVCEERGGELLLRWSDGDVWRRAAT